MTTTPAGIESVERLRDRTVSAGERWIFSAGFNVPAGLRSTGRIDCELEDLERLVSAGARVAVLSHQGNHADGSARHLDDVASYVADRLGCRVRYVAGPDADIAVGMRDGECVLFGNARLDPGEQANDPALARRFAALGDRVAVGGFSKAHRAHASNVGVLDLVPGCAAESLALELESLAPWAGRRADVPSAVAVGGLKREKVRVGLLSFARTYDLVIPGGAVLNAVLVALGRDIGASTLGECGDCVADVRALLTSPRGAVVHVPDRLVVAPVGRAGEAHVVASADGVPAGHEVVDFLLKPAAEAFLARSAAERGRLIVAGTPGRYTEGFTAAGDALLRAAEATGDGALLLGGDTVAELPWDGAASTGGGAALQYLATGSCAVLEALARNRARIEGRCTSST